MAKTSTTSNGIEGYIAGSFGTMPGAVWKCWWVLHAEPIGCPTYTGECGILLSDADGRLSRNTPGSIPSVKATQSAGGANALSSTSSGALPGPCKFWGSEHVCKQGEACKFEHVNLPDARDRCWTCSSTTHRKAECPYKAIAGDNFKLGLIRSGGAWWW